MSSTINASTASGGGVITTADASGILQLQTGGTTALTIDASQNVGIGTSSPGTKLDVYGSNIFSRVTDGTVDYRTLAWTGGNSAVIGTWSNHPLLLQTNNTEKARIDSSGNLLVGTTSAIAGSNGPLHVVGNTTCPVIIRNSAASTGKYWRIGPDTSASNYLTVNENGNGVYIVYGGTSWTAYSDERLKTNLIPIENGLDKVNSLRSVTGRFKTDEEGVSRSFLIAQDVQKVLPEAVSVQDDELGTLGVAYTEVIPLLVASIKELKVIIDTQNARIEALEAK